MQTELAVTPQEHFESLVRGSLRGTDEEIETIMRTVQVAALKTIYPALSGLPPVQSPPIRPKPVTSVQAAADPPPVAIPPAATPPAAPRPLDVRPLAFPSQAMMLARRPTVGARIACAELGDGEFDCEELSPPLEPDAIVSFASPRTPLPFDGPWTDAHLMRLTRDTRWWTPNGDYYDARAHIPVLYACAKWVNWPDPHLPPLLSPICVEIGVREGISTLALLHAMRETDGRLISIDCDPETAATATDHITRAGLASWWTLHIAHSDLAVEQIPPSIDLLWIDGDHSYEQVTNDLANYLPRVRQGGVVLMHDYYAAAEPDMPSDVARALIGCPQAAALRWTVLPWSFGLVIGVMQ